MAAAAAEQVEQRSKELAVQETPQLYLSLPVKQTKKSGAIVDERSPFGYYLLETELYNLVNLGNHPLWIISSSVRAMQADGKWWNRHEYGPQQVLLASGQVYPLHPECFTRSTPRREEHLRDRHLHRMFFLRVLLTFRVAYSVSGREHSISFEVEQPDNREPFTVTRTLEAGQT